MKYLIIVILLIGAGLFVFLRSQPREQGSETIAPTNQTALSTKTSSEGSVTVKATPADIPNGQIWKFKIVLDTHSDELDQDLTKIITLEDDKGISYTASSWEGSPPGGHHREGELLFNSISPKPGTISLIIKNIGGIGQRTLLWELGGE